MSHCRRNRHRCFVLWLAIGAVAGITGCTTRDGTRTMMGPSVAPVATLAATGEVSTVIVDDLVRVSQDFQSEVATLEFLIDQAPPSQSPAVRSLQTAVQLEAGYEFLIGQFTRLLDGDHAQAVALLNGALAQLKEFKKKLQDGLVNDTLPADIRHAAETSLATSDQLQSLIFLALGGCTEAPC
jgi:hypothetical protein